MRTIAWLAGVAATLAMFSFAAERAASAGIIIVEAGTATPIISSADIAAADEPVIIICRGVGSQTEPVVIGQKDVRIFCPGWHFVATDEPAVTINAGKNNVTLNGSTVRVDGRADGVRINSGRNVHLANMTIIANRIGPRSGIFDRVNTDDSQLTITNVTVEGFGNDNRGGGVTSSPGSNMHHVGVFNSRFLDNRVGADVQGGAAMIKDSQFINNATGILQQNGSAVLVGGNHIFNNDIGFRGFGFTDGLNNFFNPVDVDGSLTGETDAVGGLSIRGSPVIAGPWAAPRVKTTCRPHQFW